MSNEIHIGIPYITSIGKASRLCADITRPSGKFTYWFEVPKEYEEYLCTERSNSFVLAVLEQAMYMGYDIKCDAPIDETLYYQLQNYGMKILSDNLECMHNIKIDAPFTHETIENTEGG